MIFTSVIFGAAGSSRASPLAPGLADPRHAAGRGGSWAAAWWASRRVETATPTATTQKRTSKGKNLRLDMTWLLPLRGIRSAGSSPRHRRDRREWSSGPPDGHQAFCHGVKSMPRLANGAAAKQH